MPHIAVNTRLLLPHRTEGISRFAYELLSRVASDHPEVTFTYFFDRPYDPVYLTSDNIRAEVLFPPARHPVLWHAWFHWRIRNRLSSLKPDLFYSPELYLSLNQTIPEIATFHDLAYEQFPDDLKGWAGRYVRKFSPRYAHHAREILTVSEFTRQELVQRYGVSQDKIHVVHNSAGQQFHPIEESSKTAIRHRFTNGKPYLHFVGTIQPRKNLVNLLKAYDSYRSSGGKEVALLLVGRPGWNYQAALETYESLRYKEDVIFSGYVSDLELNEVYAASEGLVYVPWLEGFGIPVVEAFRAEVPVITSNTSSLPEVAGDAALLVDPGNPHQIAMAMGQLLEDTQLRSRLIVSGIVQREKFSWQKSARTLWNVLNRYL